MGFFIITLSTLLYLSVGILLKCGKHLHDCLISPREECQAHKTSLTLSLFNEVSVLRQESERSSNLLEVSNLPLSTILMFDFGIVPTVWYFGNVPTVWYFGIVPTVWYFGIVPTVWYLFVFQFITKNEIKVFLECSQNNPLQNSLLFVLNGIPRSILRQYEYFFIRINVIEQKMCK